MGWELNDIHVLKNNLTEVETVKVDKDRYSFQMSDEPVSVCAEYGLTDYTIVPNTAITGGSLNYSVDGTMIEEGKESVAKTGSKIRVFTRQIDGYEVDSVWGRVAENYASVNAEQVGDNEFELIMPCNDISLQARFRKLSTLPSYYQGIVNGSLVKYDFPSNFRFLEKTLEETNGVHTSGWYYAPDSMETASQINIQGEVNLILGRAAELNCPHGIRVVKGNTLHVWAVSTAAKINASGDCINAAIGGNAGESGGTVHIHNGRIKAVGGSLAAGIGGGYMGNGGTVIIEGNNHEITGGANAAGFGRGMFGNGGTVNINGGELHVYGGERESAGAAIGGGHHGDGGTLTVNDGFVWCVAGWGTEGWGAAIGGGYGGNGGTLVMTRDCKLAAWGNGAVGKGGTSSGSLDVPDPGINVRWWTDYAAMFDQNGELFPFDQYLEPNYPRMNCYCANYFDSVIRD